MLAITCSCTFVASSVLIFVVEEKQQEKQEEQEEQESDYQESDLDGENPKSFTLNEVGESASLVSSESTPILEANGVSVEVGGLNILKDLTFWLMFVELLLVAGSGLMWILVQGSVGVSLGFSGDLKITLVAVLAAGSGSCCCCCFFFSFFFAFFSVF